MQYMTCPNCRGNCQDPQAPSRETSDGSLMVLIRACPMCEGNGLVAVTEPRAGSAPSRDLDAYGYRGSLQGSQNKVRSHRSRKLPALT